jgi:hypothetical protein
MSHGLFHLRCNLNFFEIAHNFMSKTKNHFKKTYEMNMSLAVKED